MTKALDDAPDASVLDSADAAILEEEQSLLDRLTSWISERRAAVERHLRQQADRRRGDDIRESGDRPADTRPTPRMRPMSDTPAVPSVKADES